MNIKKIVFLALSVSASALTGAGAGRLTLAQCLDSAMVNNGLVTAADVAVERAAIMEGTAFDPDMTSVTLKQTTMDAGNPDNGIAFGQEFDFPTVYVARHKALKAETELKRAELDMKKAGVRRDVTAAYFQAVYARHVAEIRKSVLNEYTMFRDVCKKRFETGEISRLQYLSAKSMSSRNEQEYAAALNEISASDAALRSLVMCGDIEVADTLFCLPMNIEKTDTSRLGNLPEIRILDRRLELDRRNVSVAKQAFLPGITLGATTQCVISSFNPYNVVREKFDKGNLMSFEVGVSVPLFFTGKRAALRAAKRDVIITEMERSQKMYESRTLADQSYVALQTAARQVMYYENEALPDAAEMLRLARVEYENGELTYHEYIAYLGDALDVKLKRAEALNNYNQEYINYNYLSAKE